MQGPAYRRGHVGNAPAQDPSVPVLRPRMAAAFPFHRRRQKEHPMRNPHEFADLQTLCGPQFSHEEVAGKVRMLMRDDLDHEGVCTMAPHPVMHLIFYLSVRLGAL